MGDAKARIVLTKTGADTKTYYIDSGDDRIMALNHTEQEWSQVAQCVLQDTSGTIEALDFGGYKAVVSWGYGANYSACAPLWCIAQKSDSRATSIITGLSLAGTFNLMNEDRASVAYTPDSSNTDTVKTILKALVEATLAPYNHCKAYTATFDVSTGIIDTFMPKDSFRVYLNDRRLAKIKQLMQHVGYKCRVENDGEVHFFIPTTSGATYDYEYNDAVTGHNFFEKGVRKRVVIPGYFVVSSHPDHEAPYKGWTGTAQDTDYDGYPDELKIRDYKYFRVTDNTQCTNIATNLLLHKQLDAEKGHGFTIMNCGQEVFDYVKITDSKVGAGDTRTGNIGYINRKYLATGRPEDFSMEFRFGSVAPGQYLGTMPPATTGISTAALALGQMSLWDAINAIFSGDPELGWAGLISILPAFDDRIQEAKDEILQMEPDAGIPSGGIDSWQLPKGNQAYIADIDFTSVDQDTISWTEGNVSFAGGGIQAIDSGSLDLTTVHYLYCIWGNSTLQSSTTYSDAIGADRVLVAVASKASTAAQKAYVLNPHTDSILINTDKVMDGLVTELKIAADAVTATKIAVAGLDGTTGNVAANHIVANMLQTNCVTAIKINAGAVTTEKLDAGAVTAAKINVATLEAISANVGTLTSGTINGVTIYAGAGDVIIDTNGIRFNGEMAVFGDSNGVLRGVIYGSTGGNLIISSSADINLIPTGGDVYITGNLGFSAAGKALIPNDGRLRIPVGANRFD